MLPIQLSFSSALFPMPRRVAGVDTSTVPIITRKGIQYAKGVKPASSVTHSADNNEFDGVYWVAHGTELPPKHTPVTTNKSWPKKQGFSLMGVGAKAAAEVLKFNLAVGEAMDPYAKHKPDLVPLTEQYQTWADAASTWPPKSS